MKIALVTGANGFVGSHLAERLSKSGRYKVRALVRKSADLSNLKDVDAEIVHGDICDRASLDPAFSGVDLVFHVAGAVRERKKGDFVRVNCEAAKNVADATVKNGASKTRFVHVSSQAAAGPAKTHDAPKSETDPAAPVSAYGRSKLGGEDAVRAFSSELSVSIVRPPMVYGPKDTDFYDVFKMAVRGLVLKPGFRKKVYSIVHAVDLAHALIEVAEKGATVEEQNPSAGVYFVNDGNIWTWEEIARLTGEAVQKKARVLSLPESATYLAAFFAEAGAFFARKPAVLNFDKINEVLPDTWICSNEALVRDTGFRPSYPLPEGLKHTAEWYRENGLLP